MVNPAEAHQNTGAGNGENGNGGERAEDTKVKKLRDEQSIAILRIFLQNLVNKRGLEALPEAMQRVAAEQNPARKEQLVDGILETLQGKKAGDVVRKHAPELRDAVIGGDEGKLKDVLEKVLGKDERRSQEEKEAGAAIIGWFAEKNPRAKEAKLRGLAEKTSEVERENVRRVERGVEELDKQEGTSEAQQAEILRALRAVQATEDKEKRDEALETAEAKLDEKVKAAKRQGGRENFRKRSEMEALKHAVERIKAGGDSGLLDEGDLEIISTPGMIELEDDGHGGKRIGLGETAREYAEGMTDEEKAALLEAVENALDMRAQRTGEVGESEVAGRTQHRTRRGVAERLSRDQMEHRARMFTEAEKYIENVDREDMEGRTAAELSAMYPEMGFQGSLMEYISNNELKKYLKVGRGGMISVDPEMILRYGKEEFINLYYDAAMHAARQMFLDRVDSRSQDIYFNPAAKEYVAINAIQGIYELDDGVKDAIKLKTTMLYMGDAMEGGYHDPKELLGIMQALEKPGKFFMNTMRRAEGIYYDVEAEQASGRMEKRRVALRGPDGKPLRIGLFDLQKVIEQECEDPEVYQGANVEMNDVNKRTWLTMLLRENDISKLSKVDDAFLTKVIVDKLGGSDAWERLSPESQHDILIHYNTLVKDAILYEVVNERHGELFENASFGYTRDSEGRVTGTEFNLPQRIPEMWYKKSRVGMRAFCLKYGVGNVPDFFKYFDTTLPDFQLYRFHETMGHLVNKDKVNAMFYGGNHPAEAEAFAKEMEKAIVTWNVGDVQDKWWEVGFKGDVGTGIRRSGGEVARRLAELGNRPGFVLNENDFKFDKFEELTGIHIEGANNQERWANFVKNFSDGYFNYQVSASKGWPDWAGKFAGEKTWGMYEKMIALANNPLDVAAMNEVLASISTYAKADRMGQRYLELLEDILKTAGPLGYIEKVKIRNNAAVWKNAEGHEDTCLPVPQTEHEVMATRIFNPIGGKSKYEVLTAQRNPEGYRMMETAFRELKRAGFAVDEAPYRGILRRTWWKEKVAPYENWYLNVATLPLAPVRLLRDVLGFHSNAEFFAWLLGPIPDAVNWLLEQLGAKVKVPAGK